MFGGMRVIAVASGIGLAGCGAGDTQGSFDGTIGGKAYEINDAISDVVSYSSSGNPEQVAVILLASATDACTSAADDVWHPNEDALLIIVASESAQTGDNSAPSAPGDYPIGITGMYSSFMASALGPNCVVDTAQGGSATLGAVTLTAINGNVFDGTFDVTVGSGDHVTGAFHPVSCSALQNLVDALDAGSASTCM